MKNQPHQIRPQLHPHNHSPTSTNPNNSQSHNKSKKSSQNDYSHNLSQNLAYLSAYSEILGKGRDGHQVKSSSLRKGVFRHRDELCGDCLSNRSSSREKMLETKIQYMLKEQQEKMIELGCRGNKIKFNDPAQQKLNKKDSAYKKREPTFLSDYLSSQTQNKQNLHHANKQPKFHPNDTAKSNKLTLRHYINSTPESNRIRSEKQQQSQELGTFEDQTQRQEWLNQRKVKNGEKEHCDKVLEEVRELKGIFIQLLHSREQIKTKRKASNFVKEWSDDSRQAFTLP